MMKKYLLPFLILLTGCSDPLDEFIYSTGARLCGHFIILGDSLSVNESMPGVDFDEENQTYSIHCNETGAFVIGSGTKARQLISVDKLTLSTDEENRVDSLAGRWRILRENGLVLLDSLRASPDSTTLADSIRYLQQTRELANDIRQIEFDLLQEFNRPNENDPLTWKTENSSVTFHTNVREKEVHLYVATKIQ